MDIPQDDMNIKATLFNHMSPHTSKIEHLTNNRERFNNSVVEGNKL